jgi:hypothetical protein
LRNNWAFLMLLGLERGFTVQQVTLHVLNVENIH